MQRFAIISLGRTGSTLLAHLLNSHPAIECGQELFHPSKGLARQFPDVPRREFLERHARKQDKPVFGFKMPFDWLIFHPGIVDDFQALDYGIIRLDRANELEHFVSVKLAYMNGDWSSESTHQLQTLVVDPSEFLTWLGYRATATRVLNAMFDGFHVHRTTYETLLNSEAHRHMLDFLGQPFHDLSTPTVKASGLSIDEAILNYQELHDYVAPTEYRAHVPAPSQ